MKGDLATLSHLGRIGRRSARSGREAIEPARITDRHGLGLTASAVLRGVVSLLSALGFHRMVSQNRSKTLLPAAYAVR